MVRENTGSDMGMVGSGKVGSTSCCRDGKSKSATGREEIFSMVSMIIPTNFSRHKMNTYSKSIMQHTITYSRGQYTDTPDQL